MFATKLLISQIELKTLKSNISSSSSNTNNRKENVPFDFTFNTTFKYLSSRFATESNSFLSFSTHKICQFISKIKYTEMMVDKSHPRTSFDDANNRNINSHFLLSYNWLLDWVCSAFDFVVSFFSSSCPALEHSNGKE